MSIENTLAERGNRYGDFTDHARLCQDLKDVMTTFAVVQNTPNSVAVRFPWGDLPATHKQALEVIADKIARILSGDPNYADNWHDIQGYAKLVEDRLPQPAEGLFDEAAAVAAKAAADVDLQQMRSAGTPIDPADVDISGEIPPDQWRAGDVVECMENHSNQFTKGRLYILDRDNTPRSIMVLADDRGESNGWGTENFRFHSRPTK